MMNNKLGRPIDFSKLKRYSLKRRASKVDTALFAKGLSRGSSFSEFLEALPDTLIAKDLLELVDVITEAIKFEKQVVMAMGGHVIKVGLSPQIIDMLKSGCISHVMMNGAGMIHDFEIAFNASTSENVDKAIEDGSFGMAIETGKFINEAITEPEKGLGYNVGRFISESDLKEKKRSILATCYESDIPVTVHVAFGTDIIHYHPEFKPGQTGIATHADFKRFIQTVSGLEGGVFLNFGSAVIIPEVFLKAIAVVRNSGVSLREIFTANFDFIVQYRCITNVIKRPTNLGGKGFNFTGHHEIMFPLLYACIKEKMGCE